MVAAIVAALACVGGWAAAGIQTPAPILGLQPAPPVSDDDRALADNGAVLFFDKRISSDGTVACATCHNPKLAYSDGQAVSRGTQGHVGSRNAPSILNVTTFFTSFGWDGSSATLDDQIAKALFGPTEMALSPTELGDIVDRLYPARPLSSGPAAGFVIKALGAFVRNLSSGSTRFDRYLFAGDAASLTASELRGYAIFKGAGHCVACHTIQHASTHPFGGNHATFTDGRMHAIGVEKIRGLGGLRDPGRFTITGEATDYGLFKTPSLRNVALTAPYMHDGSIPTLEGVVDFYDRGGNNHYNQDMIIRPLGLSSGDKADLVAFLRTLTDPCFEGAKEPRCRTLEARATP